VQLASIIKQKIKDQGPISFRDFMEMALYYPGLGYYTSSKEKIGEKGDFYTSSNVTPAFGAMIAKQLEEMFHHLGKEKFTVVEFGAGTGKLCKDILNHLKTNEELYSKLNYCIIEKSVAMRQKEKTILNDKVNWFDSVSEMEPFTGCVLSNELIDNFSVHQVIMMDELMEVFVDDQNGFTEVLKPAKKELKDYFSELKVELPRGFRTEINLEVIPWMKDVATALKRGYVMTIDYGYPSGDLYCEQRKNGTLVCYNKHQVNYQPYAHVGEQDITSHVNFSALCLWGYKHGLEFCGYRDQGSFLIALGFKDHIKTKIEQKIDLIKFKREVDISNLLLEDMGKKFKVLIQQKQIPGHQLRGLRNL
jgi:SAM-dependent MidA family methyltransferase